MSYRGAALALSGTLVTAFVLCATVQAVVPSLQFAHAWLSLFTSAPLGTLRAWFEGVISSLLVGLVLGHVFAYFYNLTSSRS